MINKSIKENEVNKYNIVDYSKKDLQAYSENIAKNLNTNADELKKIFKQYDVNYNEFLKKHKIELLWNTLIFRIYQNQTNVNMVDIDNEVEKFKENKSEEEIEKIKEKILRKRKSQKLDLFSRSHFSNLENSISIDFQ